MIEENEKKSQALSSFALAAFALTALLFLFISNPKPEQVYALLQEEAVENIRQQMSQNALIGLVESELARQVTPDRMRAFFDVQHVDAVFASMFVVEPTELGKFTLQLANKPADAVLFCGLATKVFPCPSFVASKFSNLTADIRPESTASTEAAIAVDDPNAADISNDAVQVDTNQNHSAPIFIGGAAVTADLKKLVAAWNEAHSKRESGAFAYLYDDSILFYRVQKIRVLALPLKHCSLRSIRLLTSK
jgi:hypothetical protein